jgi:hypothetical protein
MEKEEKIVQEILELDAKYRSPGIMNDIFTFESLEKIPWKNSLPTLIHGKGVSSKTKTSPNGFTPICNTFKEFKEAIDSQIPYLSWIWLNSNLIKKRVVVAGGMGSDGVWARG